jgi:signal transduction histidine kinase
VTALQVTHIALIALCALWAAVPLAGAAVLRRRRRAANRAIHELRRPLQALALGIRGPLFSQLEQARLALGDLERAVNGGRSRPELHTVSCRTLLDRAAARWRPAIGRVGRSVRVDCRSSGSVLADSARLDQALDNLIANALEHSRGTITLECLPAPGRARFVVRDEGDRTAASPVVAFDGDYRGQGLSIVGDVARAHGGRVLVGPSGAGTAALLEIPLARPVGATAAA